MDRNTIDIRLRKTQGSNLIPALWLVAIAGLICQNAVKLPCAMGEEQQAGWKAGIASIVITPDNPMWMAGYAARTKPSEGKVQDLYAKALALEDSQGQRLVIVTVELIGINLEMRHWLEKEVNRRYKLEPAELLINASHTHSGPVLRKSRDSIYGHSFYGLTPEQIEQCNEYCDQLQEKLALLIGEAMDKLTPARLAWAHGRADFAMNRRSKVENSFQISPNPDAPVDHDVPVLRIDGPNGELRAILFGYACHNTTLSFYQFCGDYAGFAQQYLEEAHPQAKAFFITGCGADQNPHPRGTLTLAQQHGRELANGVEAALLGQARPVQGPIKAALKTVTLEFAEPPSKERLLQEAKSENKYERQHAEILLKELEQTGAICTTYPYMLQVLRFGDDLTLIALAGEVVVDYSLRLKAELGGQMVWVAGYSNDVFGYIPSLRVLREGGYEAGGAMRYTELPGPFAPSVEELIMNEVHKLVDTVRIAGSN